VRKGAVIVLRGGAWVVFKGVHRCSGKWVWAAGDSMCQPLDSCV
jgi:hypothetical protein